MAYGRSEDPAADLHEGEAAALEAVQLDERNPYTHYALAIASNYRDDFALALRSAEKAVELSPCLALGQLVHGMSALYSGNAGRAVQSLVHGLRLNRYDPRISCGTTCWRWPASLTAGPRTRCSMRSLR